MMPKFIPSLIGFFLTVAAQPAQAVASKPNILVVLVDEWIGEAKAKGKKKGKADR